MNNDPVKLSGPIFRPPWSSNTLSQIYDRLGGLGAIGEVWDTAVSPTATVRYFSGETEYFCDYLNVRGLTSPPLVKLLSAGKPLSVQVHPDSRAAAIHNGQEKTELWYVLCAEEGSVIYYGTREGVTKEELCDAIYGKRVTDLLVTMPASEGDVIVIPPGMIHSLGGGITVLEVQNNVGTTYRLQDISSDRETHPAEALDSVHFYTANELQALTFSSHRACSLPGELIASMEDFAVSVCCDQRASVPGGGVYMLCIKGCGETVGQSFKAGESLYFPCAAELLFAPDSSAIFVLGK